MARERKAIYVELLVVVGLLVIPSFLKALYAFLNPSVALSSPENAPWQFGSMVVEELLLLALLWHVLRLNGESFADLKPPFVGMDVLRGIGLWIWGYVSATGVTVLLWKIMGGREAAEGSVRAMEVFQIKFNAFYLLAMIVNPFAEEFYVRGFLQTRLRQAGHGGLPIVLLSTGLQTSYHIYQGWVACLSLLPCFLVFALYYQAHRRLWPVLIAHLIMDLVAMLAYMKTG